jgi:hypothetical protein
MAITVKHKTIVTPPLILASASPRRAQLLTEAGYRFTVIPSIDRELAHRPHSIPVDLWPACVAFRKPTAQPQNVCSPSFRASAIAF